MNGLHGIIFSYEQEPGLRELAERRMPASIPFGGRYRVVDFMLSNLHAAGITDVGVVLHGNYQSLLDHIGNGKTWDMARKYGGLRILPPFADTRAYQWLTAYAAEYGFILRYPEDRQAITGVVFEPWHWRYVGVENALAIRASGLSLEEFLAEQKAL